MIDIEKYRKALEERKSQLQSRLNEIERTLDEPAPKDDEDRATEREDDEVLERMGHDGQRELASIRAALGRMDEGTYGECVECGEEISDERLDLLPFTPYCRRCAAAHDR